MGRLTHHFVCRSLLLLLIVVVPAIAADTPWIEVRSEHFTVITDAGEKNGRHVAERFEQMRTVFGLLFGREKINQSVPLEIVAFRSTKEMREYSPIFQGKIVQLSGFFQQAEDKDFIAVDMSQEESWRTVFHEYAHVLLNANYPPTAPWFDEGFAEFLSTIKVSPSDIQIGQAPPEAAFLMQGNKLHLLELFQVQHHSETYNVSGERREMFYVESWLVVHYLFDTNRVPDAAKYFALVNEKKMPVAEAVRSAFGVSPEELEKTILNYLRAGKVKILRYTGKEKVSLTYSETARPLDSLETRAQLADLHLHSEDYVAQAIKEFEQVLQADPNQVEAQRGLGYAYLRNRQLDKAGEHFQAAAKLGSKDARVYYYSAVLLQQSGASDLTSPELVKDLRRAIELDPQYADAYGMLGVSLMNSGKDEEGAQNLRHAMELSPRNEMYRLNYAMVLMNEQKPAEAQALLTSVANGSNPEAAQFARQELSRINEYEESSSKQNGVAPPTASFAEHEEGRGPETAPETTPPPPSGQVAKYLQGTLVGVDCSSPPAAVLTVTSGKQTWKMKVANTDHAIIIGADKFSCSWSKHKVGLNYRPTGADEGSVISLEIQ